MSARALLTRQETTPGDRERARLCLLDWLGVALAGAERADALLPAVPEGASPLVGGGSAAPEHAVLRNAAAGHLLDYDDTMPAALAHPSAVLWPVLIAAGLDGGRLVTAFLRGVEALAQWGPRYGSAIAARHGHPTSSLGLLAAVHALAGERRPRERWEDLRLAGALAAGSQSVFGTVGKALQVGYSARTALDVVRTRWPEETARPDETATPDGDPLRVPGGFADRIAGGAGTTADPDAGDGRHPVHGIVHKFHASCYATHGALDAFLGLDPDVDSIAAIEVRIGADFPDVADRRWPSDGLAMKFSLRGCLSLAATGADTADPASFERAASSDPVVRSFGERIHCVADPSVPSGAGIVTVRMHDGRTLQASADPAAERPDLVLLRERVVSKFLRLTAPQAGEERMRHLADIVIDDLEDADADRVAALITGSDDTDRERMGHDDR